MSKLERNNNFFESTKHSDEKKEKQLKNSIKYTGRLRK